MAALSRAARAGALLITLALTAACPPGPTDAGPEEVCPETGGALDAAGDSFVAAIADNGEIVLDLELDEARGVVLALAFQGANAGATLNAAITQGCGAASVAVAQLAGVTAERPLVAALDAGHYYVTIVGQTVVGEPLFNLDFTTAALGDHARCEDAEVLTLPATTTVAPEGGGPAPACAPPAARLDNTFVTVELPAQSALVAAAPAAATVAVLDACDDTTCDDTVLGTDQPTLLARNDDDSPREIILALAPDDSAEVSLTSVALPTNLTCEAATPVDVGAGPVALSGDHSLGGASVSCPGADLPQLVLVQFFAVEVPVGGILRASSTTSAVTILETCASTCTLGADASEAELVNLAAAPVDVIVAIGAASPNGAAWELTLGLAP